jgi:Carboxypeptidase regulatory-like domain
MSTKQKIVSACLVTLCATLAWGQTVTGTIRGTITDASGAVVAGADVTVTNEATGVASTIKSSASGGYDAELLPVGTYRITVTLAGFKGLQRDNVDVQLGNITGLDLRLEIGDASQTVNVTAAAPILKTTEGQTTAGVSTDAFADLPLSAGGGRNPSSFTALTPGVNTSNATSTNGAANESGLVTLEGVTSQSLIYYGEGNSVRIPPEAVQEMSVVSSAYNAEYGNTGGGVQRYSIKSGTNQYHGNMYEFFKNTALDARGFFAVVRPVDRQNEYGFSLGGPVSIPKVYNGKNRSFFFWNADWYKTRGGSNTSIVSLPNAAARVGDFSGYLAGPIAGATNPCGGGVQSGQIFDPQTTQVVNGQSCRNPFPGNIIPANRMSPTALAFYKLLPPSTTQALLNNTTEVSQPSFSNFNDYTIKWDQYFGANHHLSGSFVDSSVPNGGGAVLPAPLITSGTTENAFDFSRLTYDWVIKPNLVNEMTLGYNRYIFGHQPTGSYDPGWQQYLGVAGYQTGSNLFPGILWAASDYQTTGNQQYWYSISNSYIITDGLNWSRGHHNIKFGFENDNLLNTQKKDWPVDMTFNRNSTGLPTVLGTTGEEAASFDLGLMQTTIVQQLAGTNAGYVNRNYMEYVQDDWKVSPRLTVNIGFRVETYTPQKTEYAPPNNYLSGVDLRMPNSAAGGLLGTYVFAGVNGQKSCLSSACGNYTGYAPRMGYAWKVNDRLVIRGGYGISYFPTGLYGAGDNIFSTDGYDPTSTASSPDNGVTPAATFATGFPAASLQTRNLGPQVNIGTSFQYYSKEAQTAANTQSWNVSTETQLAPSLALDVAYVGTKGSHLSMALNINQLNPSYLSLGTSLLQSNITSPAAVAAGFTQPWPGFASTLGALATVGQSLRPYPQYLTGFGYNSDNEGNSTYQALQAKLEKRMSNGLYLLTAFTFDKSITNSNTTSLSLPGNNTLSGGTIPNQYNYATQRSVSQLWQPFVLSIASNYDLPIGPGKRFLPAGRVLGRVTGGWRLGAILLFRTGALISVTQPTNLPLYAGTQYANPVPGVSSKGAWSGSFNPASDLYLNPSAFALAPTNTFGTGSWYLPNVFAPFYSNANLSLSKSTKIKERLNAELRIESFNALNQVIFAGPAANISTLSTFGKITTVANSARNTQIVLKINF